jgi:hypothetical protein
MVVLGIERRSPNTGTIAIGELSGAVDAQQVQLLVALVATGHHVVPPRRSRRDHVVGSTRSSRTR